MYKDNDNKKYVKHMDKVERQQLCQRMCDKIDRLQENENPDKKMSATMASLLKEWMASLIDVEYKE